MNSRFPLAIGLLLGCAASVQSGAQSRSLAIFSQPATQGIAGNFFVPPATRVRAPDDRFALILWEPNPGRADGSLVPTTWPAGDRTGFYPPAPVSRYQLGFQNRPGATTAQMAGNTVGVYLNSADLPHGSHKDKFMITPAYTLAPPERVKPFADPGSALAAALELQVPTASNAPVPGNNTYVNFDITFVDAARNKISFGCGLFFNGHTNYRNHVGFDQDSRSTMVGGPVAAGSPFLTLLPGSSVHQGAPWSGWKPFRFAITQPNFAAALRSIRASYPNAPLSLNPADYAVLGFHLNAEMHFPSAPAELGWSMKNAVIDVRKLDAP